MYKYTFVCSKFSRIWRKFYFFVIFSLLDPSPGILYSKSLIEKTERMEVDWGRLKIRFYGKARPESESESYSEIEKRAWNEGLLEIKNLVADFHLSQFSYLNLSESITKANALAAGERIATSTYSYKNQYGADGEVVVFLENSLSKALRRNDLPLKSSNEQNSSSSVFSGLVIRLKEKVSPKANYVLVDESGRVLFDVNDVSKEAYEKSLMGRWFVEPTRDELIGAVGKKPVSLEVTAKSDGVYEVSGYSWNEATADSKHILSQARIALALPK